MNKDEYNEIVNGYDTIKTIADKLKKGQAVIIGWTDEEYTHYDLLFTYNIYKEGPLQGGLKGNELFVSVIGLGAFGFAVKDRIKNIHSSYIAEKLNLSGNPDKLGELINDVIKETNYEKSIDK